MVTVVEKTYAVTPTGVGRKDYSINVERSTESVIRSWQATYFHPEILMAMAAGEARTVNITIPSDYVILLYDVRLVTEINVLIELEIQEQDVLGVWSPLYRQMGYARIIDHITQGFPVFRDYRIIATNHSTLVIDEVFTVSGIETTRQEYELVVFP